jgi:F-type H+-transporting ATPase subunit b
MGMNGLWAIAVQAPEAGTPGLFDINTGLSIWTVVIFLVLLAVLYKFAYPHILGAVEAREQRIRELLDAAVRDRAEAEALLAEQKRQLTEARHQAQQLLAEGRQAGERVREDIMARARAEQEEFLLRARQEIQQERDQAIDALRREVVDLAIAAASRLIGRNLDADDDRRIVQEFLGQVDAGAGVS